MLKLLFSGFEWVHLFGLFDGAEKVKERLGVDGLSDDSLLAGLFVLLFLLDFFNAKVLALPFDLCAVSTGGGVLLDVELLCELLVCHQLVLGKIKDNREVVSSFLVDD